MVYHHRLFVFNRVFDHQQFCELKVLCKKLIPSSGKNNQCFSVIDKEPAHIPVYLISCLVTFIKSAGMDVEDYLFAEYFLCNKTNEELSHDTSILRSMYMHDLYLA